MSSPSGRTPSLLSRRDFLLTLAATLAGVALAPMLPIAADEIAPASTWDETDGALLVAFADALLAAYPVDLERYRNHYLWMAQHDAGVADAYRAMVGHLKRLVGVEQTYSDLSQDQRRRLLRFTLAIYQDNTHPLSAPIGVFLQHTLDYFMATDAWLIVGYSGYPTQAKGLDSYLQPIGGANNG